MIIFFFSQVFSLVLRSFLKKETVFKNETRNIPNAVVKNRNGLEGGVDTARTLLLK